MTTKIRHAALNLVEIFETVNEEKSLDALKIYIQRYPQILSLMKFYFTKDMPEFVDTLNYRQPKSELSSTSILASIGNILAFLELKYQEGVCKKRMEGIMEILSISEMMFMENFFTKSLEEYYPNVDWEYLKDAIK